MSPEVSNGLRPSGAYIRLLHSLSEYTYVDDIKADFFNKDSIHKLYNFLRQLGAS
jgi:hypothetical protein